VEFVLSLISSGWTVDQILQEMPQLEVEDVHACMACATDVLRLLIERELHRKFMAYVNEVPPSGLEAEGTDEVDA